MHLYINSTDSYCSNYLLTEDADLGDNYIDR
jgi:hypothetical protein